MTEEEIMLEPEADSGEVAPKTGKTFKYLLIKWCIILAVLAGSIGFGMYKYSVWNNSWSLHFQSPIQNFIRIEPRTTSLKIQGSNVAQAAEPSFEDKIRAAFGVHADTFIKIAHAESGQNAGSKGYNCMYGDESRACKAEDRDKAWSVDCGALQINVYGTICPVELFDLDKNLEAAQGKFERQGYGAWSVCKNKKVICR